MSDLLAGLGAVLLDGPILALLLVVYSIGLGGICWFAGARVALRKVDAKRASVQAAWEQAAAEEVARRLPEQRDGEQS